MKIMAGIIALICATMIWINWDTALAAAWCVAFCGWLPHAFAGRKEVAHGNQA